jgi:hypothetical protein
VTVTENSKDSSAIQSNLEAALQKAEVTVKTRIQDGDQSDSITYLDKALEVIRKFLHASVYRGNSVGPFDKYLMESQKEDLIQRISVLDTAEFDADSALISVGQALQTIIIGIATALRTVRDLRRAILLEWPRPRNNCAQCVTERCRVDSYFRDSNQWTGVSRQNRRKQAGERVRSVRIQADAHQHVLASWRCGIDLPYSCCSTSASWR